MGLYSPDRESPVDNHPEKSRCNKCCAYGSFIACIVILVLLLAGVILFAFLQGNLPEIRVQRLDVHRLNVTNTKSSALLTAAEFVIRMNATNKNGNIGLSYSKLEVEVESEDINIGRTEVEAFYQKPHSMQVFTVSTHVKGSQVKWYDAKDLKTASKQHLMVINVVFKGKLRFIINGNKVMAFPFKVACEDIDQSEIDAGHAHRCNVKISMFS